MAGDGPPLLLVHSINACGSAYEVKPIFERFRATHRVYAPDLPGFGFSDRSARPYQVRLFVDAIHDMLDAIARDSGAGAIDALALSLASEFLARAATEQPERCRSLAFVTPTGFDRRSSKSSGAPGSNREVPGLHAALTFPLWRQGLFGALTSRRSIRYFLKKTFGSDEIDEALLDYDYLSAHQPGAQHAVYAFASGRLFSKDIRSVYEQLACPVWMPHATRGDFQDFSGAGWVRDRPDWTVQPFPTGALIHFEQPDAFAAAYRTFLARPHSSDSRSPRP